MNDLTLASCCQREMEERERIEGYKQLLLQHDPTATRQDILRKTVLRDETYILPVSQKNLSDDDSELSSLEEDGELGAILLSKSCLLLFLKLGQSFLQGMRHSDDDKYFNYAEALRMKRMTELREQLESRQRMEQSGYGLAQEIDGDKLLVRVLYPNAATSKRTVDCNLSKIVKFGHPDMTSAARILMQDIVKEEVLSNTVCCIVHPSFSRKLDLLEFVGSIASRNRQDRYFIVTEEGGHRLSSVFGFADKSTGGNIVHACFYGCYQGCYYQ